MTSHDDQPAEQRDASGDRHQEQEDSPQTGVPRPPVGRWRRVWTAVRRLYYTWWDWWLETGGYELRAAWLDTRRAPAIPIAGAVLLFWPLSGWSFVPVLAGAAVLVCGMWTSRALRTQRWIITLQGIRRWRRIYTLVAAATPFVLLVAYSGPLEWGLATGLWLFGVGVSDTWRARRRLVSWMIVGLAETAGLDTVDFRARRGVWDGRQLVELTIFHSARVGVDQEGKRKRLEEAVHWRTRHAGRFAVDWPAGRSELVIRSIRVDLPRHVDDQLWPEEVPGVPLGVTTSEHANAIVHDVDSEGNVVEKTYLLVEQPSKVGQQKGMMVIGGTGGGKTNFVEGYLKRALRKGVYPGGVIIIDGKGSGSYAAFVGREGILRIARTPDEWREALEFTRQIMQERYDENWNHVAGTGKKPDHTAYLLVVEEAQEIRRALGREAEDHYQAIARLIRESGGKALFSTQRPDAADAIPGAVRDQLEVRVVLGFVTAQGARMALEDDWQAAVDTYGAEPIPGRGIVRLRRAELIPIQTFRSYTPVEKEGAEEFYPPKRVVEVVEPPTEASWKPPSSGLDSPRGKHARTSEQLRGRADDDRGATSNGPTGGSRRRRTR